MTVNLTLLIVMGVMFAVGVYLLLERSLTRVLLGIIMISNGANLLVLQTAGRAGEAPLVRAELDSDDYLDPLPQALLLTAIVIAFAMVAIMLALIYRSWVLSRQDEVADDEEDRRVAQSVGAHDPEEDAEVSTETSEFIDEVDPNTGAVRTAENVSTTTGELKQVSKHDDGSTHDDGEAGSRGGER